MTQPAAAEPFNSAAYTGTPFKDPHVIPGRLLFVHFDRGG